MNNDYIKCAIRFFIGLVLLSTLNACGDSSNTESKSNQATTAMPAAVQKLSGVGGGTLRAFVTIDGNTAGRTEMTIDSTGAGSASASISGLTLAVHTILIEYEYTDGTGTITLASASNTVDLSTGDVTFSFVAGDYDLASYDEDNDGVSNADELAAGTDPRDDACVIGASLIGSCTLG